MTQSPRYLSPNIPASSSTQIRSTEEARLSDLRWQLQSDIAKLIHDKKEHAVLSETKGSYNEIIDALHNLTISARLDPMERLPCEIITNILLEIAGAGSPLHTPRDMATVLSFTLVSKRWQNFILSEPLLWNTISLTNQHDRDALVALQLKLSLTHPLTIQLQFPIRGWDSVHARLLKHQDRVKTIARLSTRSVMSNSNPTVLEDLSGFLDNFGPLPNLTHLVAQYGETIQADKILDRFPSITEISNFPFNENELRSIEGRLNMHALDTYTTPHTLLSMIDSLKNLRRVYFHNSPTLSLQDSDTEKDSCEVPSLTSPLGWIELVSYQYHSEALTCIPYCFSSLVILKTEVGIKAFFELLHCIHQFTKLHKVEITIRAPYNGKTSPPDNICANMNMLSLHLTIYCLESFETFTVPADSDQAVCFRLNIYDWRQLSTRFSLGEWFNGEILDLSFSCCTFTSENDIQVSSSVRKLSFYGPAEMVHSLSSNFVTSLSFMGLYSMSFGRISSPQVVNLDLWPSLESLQIVSRVVEWGKFSLAFLRRVDVSHDREYWIADNSITSFIRELAYRPESYPSLEDIALKECPEWDILMIMLERRNLLTGPSIQPIQKLRLPSKFPRYIFRIVRDLLRCKWAVRPSNKELSMAGNAEIILDLSLPGCYKCHRRLQACSAPTRVTQGSLQLDQKRKLKLDQLMEYPNDEDEILATWASRANLWHTFSRERIFECLDHRSGTFEDITADSCEEPF